MDVIWLLIPLSVVLVLLAVRAFVWAVRTRQFDDLDREASRILFEESSQSGQQPEDQRHD